MQAMVKRSVVVVGIIFCLAVEWSSAESAPDRAPLKLSTRHAHDAEVRTLENGGGWEIVTTGGDPYVLTEPFAGPLDSTRHHVLSFEFFSTTGTDETQVFVLPPAAEKRSVRDAGLVISQVWTPVSIDLKPAFERGGRKPTSLRIDFGSRRGNTVRIRNVCLRAQSPEEREAERARTAGRERLARQDAEVRAYLGRAYAADVSRVSVTDDAVKIEGRATGAGFVLAELPAEIDATTARRFPFTTPIAPASDGRFEVSLPRRPDAHRDRLLSRWAVANQTGTGHELASHARWADDVRSTYDTPEVKPRHKKGLGGFYAGGPVGDLDELGISAVTVNVWLNGIMRTTPGKGRTPFEYGGRTCYADDGAVAALDRTMTEAANRNAVVSAIILVNQAAGSPDKEWGRLAAHPDADPSGTYVMPNVTTAEGVRAYAAALDFLARRYSGPPDVAVHGRIHHWIMHNEVDAGWVWTNAGEKPPAVYMDLYHRSMRMAQLIARQYDPHAKAFISLTHHWAETVSPQFYPSRDLLELLLQFSKAEGDFDWGIAHHPYPQNLFDPRVWADTQATNSPDTPKITFKNLQVLDGWVRRPEAMFRGERVRSVHLTEQGLNSRDYSEKSLTDQAAGMAYAWNKIKDLPSIEVFHYHNWIDHPDEGGLRIGLRRFRHDKDEPMGKKPIWHVYRALGTPDEAKATEFAKQVIGIRGWDEVRTKSP